ncbi:MAG: alpha-L-rhamnosidase [Clostridia bacterium]|nr:alpha-L-rhamnosidase [Clostridia bacterium]
MSIIENFDFVGEDKRKRKFLMPKTVVKTTGNVVGIENLLVKRPLQIGLSEPDFILMESTDSENASFVLDFGHEIHGGIRLLVPNFVSDIPYPEIRITFGESLSEAESIVGEDTSTNDHSTRQFTVPIPRYSDTEWGQTGFRFVKIELMTKGVKFRVKSALAVFVYHDFEYKGGFECSDPKVNKIFDTAAYTVHLCLQNMVWDGIKRDRLVWIGDMMIETMTVRDLFGRIDLVEESLEFVRDQTPLPGWMNTYPAYSMWWVLILHDWYKATGNREFLARQSDYLNGLVKLLGDAIGNDGVDNVPGHFLDWPTNADPKKRAAQRSLHKQALLLGAELCRELGLTETADYAELKAKILSENVWDGGNVKQIVAVQSLAGDLDVDTAADIIENGGIKGFSTFMGYHLLSALAKAGRYESALNYMKEYYGLMLEKGATTFFEDYNPEWSENSSTVDTMPTDGQRDVHADFGAYCYKGLRHSFCHGWAAGPVPYLMEYVLGVNIEDEGCKTIRLTPHLDGLDWVKGKFPTPFGVVSIHHWRNENGVVLTDVDAPEGVKVIL